MSASTREDWIQLKDGLPLRTQAYVDGRFVDAADGGTYATINPATGEVLAEVASCGPTDVDLAVSAARESFEAGVWSESAPAERKTVLLKFAELMRQAGDELALLISLDMGKLVAEAAAIEIPMAADVLQWHAEAIDKIYGEIAPTAIGDIALVTREPVGVVGVIVPWNFPINLAVWKLAPSLAAGNSVVLKPSRQTPLSALYLAELATDAGLPAGVLNILPGTGAAVGEPLATHAEVDCLAFTGSTEVGKQLLRYSSDSNMKQVWLECGGKSPNLVFADAEDLDQAAQSACMGIFFNQGEVCSANSRLLVDRRISDSLVKRIIAEAESIAPGDPLDPSSRMGALVDQAHTDDVLGYIKLGSQSADLVLGGQQKWLNGSGCYVEPTVFANVDDASAIAQEEIFGPVLSVIPFDDEEEAVRIANSTIYGLAASVWTSNLSRAHRVSRRLRAGSVSVNTVDALSAQTPFGGVKQSGSGRDLSLHSFEKYTALKTTWIKY